jgi:hypothetical protein
MILLPAVAVDSAVSNVFAAVGSPKVPSLVMASAVAGSCCCSYCFDINGVPALARVSFPPSLLLLVFSNNSGFSPVVGIPDVASVPTVVNIYPFCLSGVSPGSGVIAVGIP